MDLAKKILIVCEDAAFKDLWTEILTAKGFQVFLAQNGVEGMAKADEIIPDLIISDVLMAQMSGSDFYKELRKRYYGKDIPFLVLLERPKMKDYFDALGVSGFIDKPVDREVLLAQIEKVFAPEDPEARIGRQERVLVVGRYEKECVEPMIAQLKEQGHYTDFVIQGEQVVSKAVMFLPSVVLIESRLLDMTPAAVIRILRQMPQFKKISILIYSFYHKSELRILDDVHLREANMHYFVQECIEAGASKYIGPYQPQHFNDKLKAALSAGNVLLIDDDAGIVHTLKRVLENKGYNVFAAGDVDTGLELARNMNPALIVLDLVMPGKSGFEALRELKNSTMTRDIPVMMLTVEGGDNEIQKSLKLGAEDFIVKPVNLHLFLKRVGVLLKKR